MVRLTPVRPVFAPCGSFDEIFDPVRRQEVVADEWPNGATAGRRAQIQLAIHALSSMVADSAAHELGHSLGLALPYGSPAQYHNPQPREGCLMDAGSHRPFAERARIATVVPCFLLATCDHYEEPCHAFDASDVLVEQQTQDLKSTLLHLLLDVEKLTTTRCNAVRPRSKQSKCLLGTCRTAHRFKR